ncbi:MAG TPA: hypothetical protein VHA70_07620 [Bauldia sp.]|nr:hypothetical protein [Bauldia sp.]HVZ13149.1 hypothetical protein [Bauldia sp.]
MSTSFKHALIALAVAAGAMLAAPSAFAAGDEPSPSDHPVACKAPLVPNADKSACVPCAKGTKYDAAKKECVVVNASIMDDKSLYEAGRTLALDGYYDDALAALNAIGDKHDAMVLTMIGYSERKLGHTDLGIATYMQALAIDPNSIDTHEYLGEGYVVQGKIDLARAELSTVAKLCGNTTCEQYEDLSHAIGSSAS